jgi:hypothetical protein
MKIFKMVITRDEDSKALHFSTIIESDIPDELAAQLRFDRVTRFDILGFDDVQDKIVCVSDKEDMLYAFSSGMNVLMELKNQIVRYTIGN